jgi:hypothetical protein
MHQLEIQHIFNFKVPSHKINRPESGLARESLMSIRIADGKMFFFYLTAIFLAVLRNNIWRCMQLTDSSSKLHAALDYVQCTCIAVLWIRLSIRIRIRRIL